MFTALKTLLSNPAEERVLAVVPASSNNYEESSASFTTQSSSEDKHGQQVTEDSKDKFDFETFHKNMNKQRAKGHQV